MRETAQRQADGASKAEPRIQPVVRAVGRDWRSQDSAWLDLVRLPVHFRGLYATAVKERPPGLRAEPSCPHGQLVSRCGSVRDRALTGHVSMCQRLRWVGRLRLGCTGMTSLLGSPAPDGLVLAVSVAHCGFGGE